MGGRFTRSWFLGLPCTRRGALTYLWWRCKNVRANLRRDKKSSLCPAFHRERKRNHDKVFSRVQVCSSRVQIPRAQSELSVLPLAAPLSPNWTVSPPFTDFSKFGGRSQKGTWATFKAVRNNLELYRAATWPLFYAVFVLENKLKIPSFSGVYECKYEQLPLEYFNLRQSHNPGDSKAGPEAFPSTHSMCLL